MVSSDWKFHIKNNNFNDYIDMVKYRDNLIKTIKKLKPYSRKKIILENDLKNITTKLLKLEQKDFKMPKYQTKFKF